MSETPTHRVSLKAPSFKKDSNFQMWRLRMLAFLELHGLAYCLEAIDPELPANSQDPIDISTDEGKRQAKAKKDNYLTVAYLQAAMIEDDDMATMMEASSSNWPHGIAYEVMQKLDVKYEPNDFVTMIERNDEIAALKLGKKESPEKLFQAINMLNNKYKNRLTPMQDKEVLAIVMKKVPSKYSTILAAESVRLGAGFSVKEAKVALMTLYRAGHKEEEEETEEEVVLNASFTCYECGQKGHKASECPQRK